MTRFRLIALLAVLATMACQGSCEGMFDSGTKPTPVDTPTPAPTATATPSAFPTPPPATVVCALIPSVTQGCIPNELPQLETRVAGIQSSINGVGHTEASYVAALATALRLAGLCVTTGAPLSPDEVEVKTSNTFSEKFDVWNAQNFPQLLYHGTCKPARF